MQSGYRSKGRRLDMPLAPASNGVCDPTVAVVDVSASRIDSRSIPDRSGITRLAS